MSERVSTGVLGDDDKRPTTATGQRDPSARSRRHLPGVPRHVICIAMIWYLITPPERPNLTAGASKTVWVQGFLANRQKQTLDDASVPNCFHGGSADWTNTTRILLQTCNTIVPFYRPGGVNRLVAFTKGQHESHFDCRARAVQRKGGKPIPRANLRRN